MVHGWINLYKPTGFTSSYCLNLLKKKFKLKKIGHIGTLDPMAEGVLPIAINEATKTIPLINKSKKTYFFEVNWGKQTNTLDSEGDVINISKIIPSCEDIKKAIKKFIGKINQSPPKFSAKKLMEKEHTSLLEKELNLSLKK